jgi:DNA-directed RNA polymerase subunit M/transcription elongation factor TFIIS
MYKISNPEVFRSNIRQKISVLMNIENNDITCGNIEKGILNYSIQEATRKNIIRKWDNSIFVSLYIDRLRSIYINLKNPILVKKIADGDIKAEEVGFMSHQEFDPEHWSKLIEVKIKKDASKFTDNIQASTDVYVCRRCKSRKCTYTEVQTRSSDESMTIFVNCLSCGKNWTC